MKIILKLPGMSKDPIYVNEITYLKCHSNPTEADGWIYRPYFAHNCA